MMDPGLELLDVTVKDVFDSIDKWSKDHFYVWVGLTSIDKEATPMPKILKTLLSPLEQKACQFIYDEATKHIPKPVQRKNWRRR